MPAVACTGLQVKVRLRPAGRLREFYPFDFVLGTLLHELVHNEFGPHDQKFYKLLDTITEECEDDMSKGISGSGTGFDAKSAGKVGGRLRHHNPPEADLRRVMLDAAQKRAQSNAIMTSGGRKLGGDKHAMRSLTPAEVRGTPPRTRPGNCRIAYRARPSSVWDRSQLRGLQGGACCVLLCHASLSAIALAGFVVHQPGGRH